MTTLNSVISKLSALIVAENDEAIKSFDGHTVVASEMKSPFTAYVPATSIECTVKQANAYGVVPDFARAVESKLFATMIAQR